MSDVSPDSRSGPLGGAEREDAPAGDASAGDTGPGGAESGGDRVDDEPSPASGGGGDGSGESGGPAPADGAGAGAADDAGSGVTLPADLSVEDLLADLERVTVERDEYLALARSVQAEFENYRKRIMKQQAAEVGRAAATLAEKLLPVLDAFDYGVAHGDESLAPMRGQLLSVLEKEGLERIDPEGGPFDANEHEAVAHEPAGDGDDDHVVVETLRAGFRWQGRLLRPAMVRVRG